MALLEIVQKILNEYEYEIAPSRVFLGFSNGKKIKLKKDITEEQFFDLFSNICERLGVPIYVHSYYGFIWKKNGEFLSLNTIEESYGCNVTAIFVLSRMPIGKKVNYNEYAQIEGIVKQVFSNHNLNCNRFVHYHDEKFIFVGDSTETECILILKKHFLEFYYSKKEPLGNGMERIIPRYTRKENISLNDLSNVKSTLQNCFIVD